MDIYLVFEMPFEYYDWEIPRYEGVFKTLEEANDYADKLAETYKGRLNYPKTQKVKNIGLIESYFVLGGKPRDVEYPSCDENGETMYKYITFIIKQSL
jgi:hypothetical protein